jgi:hypothetical protein
VKLDSNWLTTKTTYDDAVQDNTVEGREFGHANEDWERLKAKMQAGDEFWYFAPPSPQVIQLWGLALVRQGSVISTVITDVD